MAGAEAHHNLPQPRSLLVDGPVHPSTQRSLTTFSLARTRSLRDFRLSCASPPAVSADVGEARKLNVSGLPRPRARRFCRMAPELDEPRLPRVQRQGELRQTRPHVLPEPLGIGLVLEANDARQRRRSMMTSPGAFPPGFIATMEGSDFSCPCIVSFGPPALLTRTVLSPTASHGTSRFPDKRFRRRARASDHAGPAAHSRYRTPPCCPGPPTPLSTLRLRPHGLTRMTRGRCGSLYRSS